VSNIFSAICRTFISKIPYPLNNCRIICRLWFKWKSKEIWRIRKCSYWRLIQSSYLFAGSSISIWLICYFECHCILSHFIIIMRDIVIRCCFCTLISKVPCICGDFSLYRDTVIRVKKDVKSANCSIKRSDG
jgi:hypothetical protein